MVTKAMLEKEVADLKGRVYQLQQSNTFKDEQLEFYRKYSTATPVSAMVIALERISDAAAHVISDLKRRF